MVYLIQVGTKTRKQTFIKHHEKVVSVSEKYSYSDVERYFGGMYEGFEVKIERVKEFDLSPELDKLPPQPNPDFDDEDYVPATSSRIRDFEVKLTETEKELHETYWNMKDKMERAANSLRSSIETRYKKLPYSNLGYHFSLELEISYGRVICANFPIKGEVFTEAAKNCEDIPCIEPPNEIQDDRPF